MGTNRHINFHTRRHVITDNIHDFTDRTMTVGGVLGDFHNHNLAVLRLAQLIGRNMHIFRQTLVIRHHIGNTAFNKQPSHNTGIGPLNHINHRTFTAPPAIHTGNLHHGPIIMHQTTHLLAMKEDVIATLIRH